MAFELLNSDGEVVAELKTTEQDEPYFTLLDKDHTARFIVQLRNGRPILILGDQNGNTRLSFGEFNDGKMGLLVMVKDSSGDVLLGFGSNGAISETIWARWQSCSGYICSAVWLESSGQE